MTDHCINALESRFWEGSETCWYKPNTSIDSSGRDQLRFLCLSRDAPQTCAERSASERDHSFLCPTRFNANKHDWTSHASCNCSISVSTTERHQQNSVAIKCHVAFHLPQQDHQCPQLVNSLEKWEEHFAKYYTIYSLYFTKPVSLNYLIYV